MGGESYYPEYYLRKRKRDQTYALFTRVAFAIVVLGGVGTLAGYLLFQYVLLPRRAAPGVTEQMAQQRHDLGIEARLAEAPVVAGREVPEFKPVDLQSLPYSDSFAASSVSLVGLAPSGGTETAAQKPAGESAAKPAESGQAAPEPPPAAANQASAVQPATEKSVTQKTKDQETKTKPKPTPEADKATASDKPAKPETKPASKPEAPSQTKDKTVYKVYAGSGKNREQAEQLKRELSGLGYSATLIESGADVLVLVAEIEDYDKASALAQDLNRQGFSSTFTTRAKR